MTRTDERKLLKAIYPDKYITERIQFYKNLMLLTKSSVVLEAKARGLKPKSTNTKGFVIEMILDHEYPY